MSNGRIWEIDLGRAAAIILMVAFHIVYDLNRFAGAGIDYLSGFWYWEGKAAALLFIFLAGVSSGFSRDNFRRGLKVLAWGMLITLVTYILFREEYVRFGILHLLGLGMLLFPLCRRAPDKLLWLAAALTALAAVPLQKVTVQTSLLIPLGATPGDFASLDYYPLSPYFPVFLLGVLAYKKYYYQKRSLFRSGYANKYLTALSKRSLAIYLLHQPVLIALVYGVKFFTGGRFG